LIGSSGTGSVALAGGTGVGFSWRGVGSPSGFALDPCSDADGSREDPVPGV
jgi:hypothetical protein